jgi:hypothetical protein
MCTGSLFVRSANGVAGMKSAILPFTLVAMVMASPVSGQQQAPKPEMPPWNGDVFANTVTDVAPTSDVRFVHAAILSHSLEKWKR